MPTTAAPTKRSYTSLSLDDLAAALRGLPAWRCDGSRLMRTVAPVDLWTLLEGVAAVEQRMDHHAALTLERGTVTFRLWTHVCDAVTAMDVELAHRIDDVLADAPQTF